MMCLKIVQSNKLSDIQFEKLYQDLLDPLVFKVKDKSLATVAKLSREFEEELEDSFLVNKQSKRLVRDGIVNIVVDTKVQKDACLVANFGMDTQRYDVIEFSQIDKINWLDILSQAKEEIALFTPPAATLECTYKEFSKDSSGNPILKVIKYNAMLMLDIF